MKGFNFEKIKEELGSIEKNGRKDYYYKKYLDLENEYLKIQYENLKWVEKIKYEIIKYKYSTKERTWINFQLNMYYQERTEYKKYKNQIEELYKKDDEENENYIKIKFLYEKIQKTIKKIKRYKEMLNEYIFEKNTYKEVSELSKLMIDKIDLKNINNNKID